jgi:hypothetical protein
MARSQRKGHTGRCQVKIWTQGFGPYFFPLGSISFSLSPNNAIILRMHQIHSLSQSSHDLIFSGNLSQTHLEVHFTNLLRNFQSDQVDNQD